MSGWVKLNDETWENVKTGEWMEVCPSFDGVKIKMGFKTTVTMRGFQSNREAELFIHKVVLGKEKLEFIEGGEHESQESK